MLKLTAAESVYDEQNSPMKNVSAIVVTLGLLFSTVVNAQNLFQKSILKDGHKMTRTMTIPEGWEASYSTKTLHKSEESYIKSTQHWRSAEGSFCINNLPLDKESIEKVIEFDMHNYAEFGQANLTVKDGAKLYVDNDKSIALVKLITGSSDAPFQAVAYIPEKTTYTVVTFYANDETFFTENMNAFETFIKSYTYNAEALQVANINSFY
jgi:hypothetical protein